MTLKVRRDTAANWTAVNPILAGGQMGYETNTRTLKFGDGVTAWNTLPYFGGAGASTFLALTDTPASYAGEALKAVRVNAGATALEFFTSASGPANTDALAEGTTNLYFTEPRVRATVLTGLSLATATAITAADSVLSAFGKLQAQTTLRATLASPDFTGIPTAPTAAPLTNTTQIATTAYVDAATTAIIAAADAMVFKGVQDCSTNPNYPAADRGWTYRVSVAGKIGGAAGPNVEVGDLLLCITDGTASGTHATVGAAWSIAQTNIDGAVIGPASVTSGNPAVFSDATGKLIGQVTFAAFKTSLAIVAGDVSGLGALATLSSVSLTTQATGVLQAAQVPIFTGDVTSAGGALALTIAASAVTLAKMADVATGSIFYRKTAAVGVPEVQTLAVLKADLALTGTNSGDQTSIVGITGTKVQFNTAATDGDFLFVGDAPTAHTHPAADITDFSTAVAATAAVTANTAKVTNATHTGDVTGATALTIALAAVTLAKMADVGTATVFYRKTAATGAPEVQTLAVLKADLGLTGTNGGDQTITLTGDVTGTGTGSFAATIAAGAVSLAKMANLAATTILGNNTGIGATPLALTPAQINAMLPVLTGTLNGLAPASGGGTANFLRADGTWTAPAGTAGITALSGDVTATGPGSVAATIAPGVVTLAKQANVATGTVFYRTTAGAGAPEVNTLAVLKADLGLTGTNSGDQTITLTGDVTGTGAGSFATTIAANVVTLAKMATVVTASFLGRITAATGNVEVLTATQAKTVLAITNTDVSGLGALATASSVNLSTQATGTLQAAQHPALTGDVTNTVGTLATTIAVASVTLAKMADVATATVFYRKTAATGVPEVQTLAVLKADLGLTGTNSGDQTITLTGDVTGSGIGSFAATIAANVVGLTKLAQIATASFLGRTTAATGNVEVLTAAQAKTVLAISLTSDVSGVLQAAQEPAHTGDVTNAAGSLAMTISAAAVTLAKMADVATGTVFYRKTAAAGVPEVQTLATLKTDLGLTGTNSGDQTITLTGDVTGTGTGSFAATVAANAVTLAKMAQVLTATFLGRTTAATGNVEALTVAQAKTLLAISLTSDVSGVLQAAQEPAHTGDVTNTAGSLALTIAAGVVSNAKLATMAANTVKANATAGAASPSDVALAASQLFGRGATGNIAPITLGTNLSMSAATLNVGPAGATTQIQYNNAGVLAGATEVGVEGNQLRLEATTSFTAPVASGVKLLARVDAGRTIPAFLSQDGVTRDLQTSLARSAMMIWRPRFGTVNMSFLGGDPPSAVGTATLAGIATTNLYTYSPKLEYLVTTAATTAIAGFIGYTPMVTVGGPSAGRGGFHFVGRWGPATGVATTTNRALFGLALTTAVPTDVEPSTSVSCVIMGWDAADANIQIMHNDGTAACTKVNLGASFPVPTADRTALYELALYSPKGVTQSVNWLVTDLNSLATAGGTISTDMPAATAILSPRGWMSVGGTSSVIGLGLHSLMLDPLL